MNRIRQVEQVFPPALLKQISEYVETAPLKYGWHSNKSVDFGHWNHDIARAGADNGLDVSGRLPPLFKAAWDHIQNNIIGEQTLIRCYTNAHTFGVEGYPHTDSNRKHDQTIVVYMNPEWRREWGGETLVYAGDDIVHAELPRYNKGMIFNGADWHCARAVTRICPELRRTLMFKYAPKNIDPMRDKIQALLIQVGADKTAHSGKKLIHHLIRTYDMLKRNGHSDTVCAAGGLHSIFGTNAFKVQTLTAEHRDIVVKLVGEEAVELIELFRDIKRPGTLVDAVKNGVLTVETNDGKTVTLTQSQLNSLCAIEAANLREQDVLKKHQILAQFLKK